MGRKEPDHLLVGIQAFNHFCEGDVLTHIGDLDGEALPSFRVWNNDNKPAFNTGDSVTLVADIFNFDRALVTLFNWWLRWIRFTV